MNVGYQLQMLWEYFDLCGQVCTVNIFCIRMDFVFFTLPSEIIYNKTFIMLTICILHIYIYYKDNQQLLY